MRRGEITVWAKGEAHRRLKAPAMFHVEPHSRRVGLTHEDTTWTTVHLTALTDVAAWERTCLAPHAFFPIPSAMPMLQGVPGELQPPPSPVTDEVACLR